MLPQQYRPTNLRLNEEHQFNHEECGDTKGRLYVRRTRNGWVFHCHNCAPKMSGFMRDDGIMSPSQTLRMINEPVKIAPEKASGGKLPEDYTPDLPDAAWMWLNKYGITPAEKEYYGLGYSPRNNRLVLPINSISGLVGWQGRALGDSKPKYMTYIGKTDGRLWFDSRHGMQFKRDYLGKDSVCLVEDIISAIKVGRQFRTIAVLGSYIREELVVWLQSIQRTRPTISWYLWLDPDKHVDMHKIANRLRGIGLNVVTVTTSCDPKDCDDELIRNLIG